MLYLSSVLHLIGLSVFFITRADAGSRESSKVSSVKSIVFIPGRLGFRNGLLNESSHVVL